MFNIFKKKEPKIAPTNYSSQNYSSAPQTNSSTSIWKPKVALPSVQSLFSSNVPKAPVSRPVQPVASPNVSKPVNYSSPQNYSSNPPNYTNSAGQAAYAPAPTVRQQTQQTPPPTPMVQAPQQSPQITLMDSFLRSQQQTADKKKQLAGDQFEAGRQLREGTYNLQRGQLEGMKGDATEAFNQFEQGTLGSLERVRGAGERNKANTEEYYGDAQRTAAQARRETQGEAQRRFSNLNTIDSFGEGSFKQANENIDSDFNRLTQSFAREKANKLADIDDQVFTAEQTAEQSIQSERVKLQQVLRQIDGTLQQGTMEHKFAQDQAMAQYQESLAGIEEWLGGIKYQTESQKLALEQELAAINQFSPEFMTTGVPKTQKEFEFLVSNQEAFGKLYPEMFGEGSKGLEEKGQIIDLVDRVLDTDTNNLTGTMKFGSIYSPKARDTQALVEQIKAKLALNERAKLAGQGTISDKDAEMLEKSVTSLNYNMSDGAFRGELNNIKRILQGQGGVGSRASGVDNMSLVQQFGG